MVGHGEQPTEKTTEEIAREAQEEIARLARLAKEADDWSFIDTDEAYHIWSSEYDNRPLLDLNIRYSSLSPSCPVRSHIKPSINYLVSQIIPFTNQGIKSTNLTSGT
jgi:hypothetical protein